MTSRFQGRWSWVALLPTLALAIILSACSSCTPDPAATPSPTDTADVQVVDDVPTEDEGPELPAQLPPLGTCAFDENKVLLPAAGATTTDKVTIAGRVRHKFATMKVAKAVYWEGECKTLPTDPDLIKLLPDVPKEEWDGDIFQWENAQLELSKMAEPYEFPVKVCIRVSAAVDVPAEYPEGTEAPVCSTSVDIKIDRHCPWVIRHLPTISTDIGAESYVGELPFEVEVFDHNRLTSLRILDANDAEIGKFEVPEEGVFHDPKLKTSIAVCDWPTGNPVIKFEATDSLGNICVQSVTSPELNKACPDTDGSTNCTLPSFAPHVIRCPKYLAADPVKSTAKLVTEIATADFDGDGDTDVLGATNVGVVFYENDGTSHLLDPVDVEAEKGPVKFIIPVDLNQDGNMDLVLMGPAEGGQGYIRSYLKVDDKNEPTKGVCTPPLADPTLVPPKPVEPTCAPGWALVEEHLVAAAVSAYDFQVFAGDMGDPKSPPATPITQDELADLIVGTREDGYAVGVVSRASDVSKCDYHSPSWLSDGTVIPAVEQATCFRTPRFISGVGDINTVTIADLITLTGSGPDVIVTRDGATKAMSVFRQKGQGVLEVGFVWGEALLPAPITQVIPGDFDFELKDNVGFAHQDLLLVLKDVGQMWQVFGTGGSAFKESYITVGQVTVKSTAHRAVCIEDKPSGAASVDVGGPTVKSIPQFPDIVAINQDAGTIWSFLSETVTDDGTTYVRTPAITGLGVQPVQLRMTHLDSDVYVDAVVLGLDGTVATVRGMDFADPTSPQYGNPGEFAGPKHVTTPIPGQSEGATDRCDGSDQYVECASIEGTPEDRLTPTQMLVADTNQDTHAELTLVAEEAPTGKCPSPGEEEPQAESRIPLFIFPPVSSTYVPNGQNAVKKDVDPSSAACFGKDCPMAKWGPKGAVVDIAGGFFDYGVTFDIALATQTVYPNQGANYVPPDPPSPTDVYPFPMYPALDIFFDDGGGLLQYSSENTLIQPLTVPPLLPEAPANDAVWLMNGYVIGSSPKRLVPLRCDTDTVDDLAALTSIQVDSNNIPYLGIFQATGSKTFNQIEIPGSGGYFLPNTKVVDLISARIGHKINPNAPPNPFELATSDPETDLIVITGLGAQVFEAVFNAPCLFQRTGYWELCEVRAAAMFDLNEDLYSDFLVSCEGGDLKVVYGSPLAESQANTFNSVGWDPDTALLLRTGGFGLGQPTAADINGDTFIDLAVLDLPSNQVLVFLNKGTKTASNVNEFHPTPYALHVAPGTNDYVFHDFDGDQCLEMVALSPVAKAAEIHLSTLNGCGAQNP